MERKSIYSKGRQYVVNIQSIKARHEQELINNILILCLNWLDRLHFAYILHPSG